MHKFLKWLFSNPTEHYSSTRPRILHHTSGKSRKASSCTKKSHPPQFTPEELYDLLTKDRGLDGPAKSTIVTSAWYCKRPRSAKHEYIILEIRDLTVDGLKNHLLLDRNNGGLTRPAGRGANPFKWPLTTPAMDAFKVVYDWDEAQLLGDRQQESHKLLARIDFPETSLFLHDLVALVCHISSQYPRYHPLDANCYWFAGLVWACMRKMCPTARHNAHAAGGRFAFIRYHPNPLQVKAVVKTAQKKISECGLEAVGLPKLLDCLDLLTTKLCLPRLHFDSMHRKPFESKRQQMNPIG